MDINFLKFGMHIAHYINEVLRIFWGNSDNWRCCHTSISASNIFKGSERCGAAILFPMCHL
jgi:hypothetical protein